MKKKSNSNEFLGKYEDQARPRVYVRYAAMIQSWMTGYKSLVVDCEFRIRFNGVKTKPIERTASQLSNDMKID